MIDDHETIVGTLYSMIRFLLTCLYVSPGIFCTTMKAHTMMGIKGNTDTTIPNPTAASGYW